MKRWLPLLLLSACLDDNVCPGVLYIDGFELVVSSETWPMADLSVDVDYGDAGVVFRCEVPIPALPALDAGVFDPDAGIDDRGNFNCASTTPTGLRAYGTAGRELDFSFEGTPPSVLVTVRDEQTTVLQTDVPLTYRIVRPYGPSCPGPLRAAARLELPQ